MTAATDLQRQELAVKLEKTIVQNIHDVLQSFGIHDTYDRCGLIYQESVFGISRYLWVDLDIPSLLSVNEIYPIKRADFPNELWNMVDPPEGSLLWKAKVVYDAGQELNKPARKERIKFLIDYKLAWVILSLLRRWWLNTEEKGQRCGQASQNANAPLPGDPKPSHSLDKTQMRQLGKECEEFIEDRVAKALYLASEVTEAEWGRTWVLDETRYENAWREVNIKSLFNMLKLDPIVRDDFPAEFWEQVAPAREGSCLWRARKFYDSGNSLESDSPEYDFNKREDKKRKGWRIFTWVVLSVALEWWTMHRAAQAKPAKLESVQEKIAPPDADKNHGEKKNRKQKSSPLTYLKPDALAFVSRNDGSQTHVVYDAWVDSIRPKTGEFIEGIHFPTFAAWRNWVTHK